MGITTLQTYTVNAITTIIAVQEINTISTKIATVKTIQLNVVMVIHGETMMPAHHAIPKKNAAQETIVVSMINANQTNFIVALLDKHGEKTIYVLHAIRRKNVAQKTIVLSISSAHKTQLTVALMDKPGKKTAYAHHADLIKNAVQEIIGETTQNSANATQLISAAKKMISFQIHQIAHAHQISPAVKEIHSQATIFAANKVKVNAAKVMSTQQTNTALVSQISTAVLDKIISVTQKTAHATHLLLAAHGMTLVQIQISVNAMIQIDGAAQIKILVKTIYVNAIQKYTAVLDKTI